MEVLAQDVNGRGRRCRLALSYLGRTGTLTRPIGEDCPLHRRANRSYPGDVLRSAEVEARLELVLGERVTAAVDGDMRKVRRQTGMALVLSDSTPPAPEGPPAMQSN